MFDQVRSAARGAGADLSKPFTESADARKQVIDYMRDLERQTGLSTKAMANAVGDDTSAMQELAKAIKKVQDQTSSAFSSSFDVISNFDPTAGQNALAVVDRQGHRGPAEARGH